MTNKHAHTPDIASVITDELKQLYLIKAEASRLKRCCDLYQDSLGTFACHECTQKTYAMMREIQIILGLDKGCAPLKSNTNLEESA